MSTTIVYPDEMFTTTGMARLKKLRSQQFRPYRITDAILSNAEKADGGERFLIPWDVQEHSITTQHVTGYETVDMDVQTVLKPGTDTWFFCVSPVVWSWVDQAKNSGKNKVIDIWQTRVENTEKRMRKEFETQLLRGSVTGMSDLIPLNGVDFSTGIIEQDAVGSQANTIHNVAKSSYSSLVGFQNQVADIAGDFSANGLSALRDMHTELQEVTDDPVKLEGFCSLAGAKNYGTTVQSNERYIDSRDAVRLDVVIAGMRYKISSLMPNAGTVTGSNDDEWSFLVLDHGAIKFHGLQGLVMDMTETRDVGGSHQVKAAFMRLAGQMGAHSFGSTGLAYGGDTI